MIGILGGSFNPVHRAHIQLALAALDQLPLQRVELMPAGRPWQKDPIAVSPEHRLAMLQLAIANHPKITINTIELEREGLTYTIDTLKALPSEHDYYWLMGSDQLQNFTSWQGWREIMQRVTLVVAQRPNYPTSIPHDILAAQAPHKPILRIDFDAQDVSSTEVRQRLSAGQDVSDWLDPKVLDYIKEHQLYATD